MSPTLQHHIIQQVEDLIDQIWDHSQKWCVNWILILIP